MDHFGDILHVSKHYVIMVLQDIYVQCSVGIFMEYFNVFGVIRAVEGHLERDDFQRPLRSF